MPEDVAEDIIVLQIPVKLNNEFFDDIICTMFEGGSNYWIDTIKINHPDGMKPKSVPVSTWAAAAINKGGSLMIFPQDMDGEVFTINKANLVTGVKLWAGKCTGGLEVMSENRQNYIDAGNIDADDADAILQYAVFGDLVFG